MPKRPSEAYQGNYAEPPTDVQATGADPVDPVTPLGIILQTMRQRYAAEDVEGAIVLARIAAPYVHPRAPASAPTKELADMTDAELSAIPPRR